MKRFYIILTFLCTYLSISAQNISVADFHLDPMDQDANLQGTTVIDQNGEKCALIKVITTLTGFTFDVGALGVKQTVQKTGEIWVYVPAGIKRMSIAHPQIGQLRDYPLPVAIQRARTYVMQLIAGNVRTIIETDDGKTYFSLTVIPKNAMVSVDGVLQQLDNNGSLTLRMNRGQHNYTIQAGGYNPISDSFTLGAEKVVKTIQMESNMANVVINSATQGASIFVNDSEKGRNSWTGSLIPGDYVIEARLQGYYPQKQTVSLVERDNKTINIPALEPRAGKLDVNFKPVGCEIVVDGKVLGTSPDLFKGVLMGTHNMVIRMPGYQSKSITININEGETSTYTGELEPQVVVEETKNTQETAVVTLSNDQLYESGYQSYKNRDFSKAFEIFNKLSDNGYRDAQYMLGLMYFRGDGVSKNQYTAVSLFKKAANQGHPKAESILGSCYYNGIGTSVNYPEAIHWCTKAARNDDETALYILGLSYLNGNGVKKNKEFAKKFLMGAAAKGNNNAIKALSEIK